MFDWSVMNNCNCSTEKIIYVFWENFDIHMRVVIKVEQGSYMNISVSKVKRF